MQNHGFVGLYRGAGVRIIGAGFQQMFRWGGYTNISCRAGEGRERDPPSVRRRPAHLVLESDASGNRKVLQQFCKGILKMLPHRIALFPDCGQLKKRNFCNRRQTALLPTCERLTSDLPACSYGRAGLLKITERHSL